MKERIIIILIVFLYFGNYQICEYFYNDDVNMWWELKSSIYSAVIVLGLYLITLKANKIDAVIVSILNALIINNIIERLYFKSFEYDYRDFGLIALVLLITYIEYKWKEKKVSRKRI